MNQIIIGISGIVIVGFLGLWGYNALTKSEPTQKEKEIIKLNQEAAKR